MSPENTGNYKTFSVFSVPIKKGATKNDKNGNETVVTISYKIKFIDSARFMASSLSTLLSNSRTRLSFLIMILINFFVLRGGIYPYKYMDEWKKLNETFPGNEQFYGNLNMEDFTNAGVRKDAKKCS